MNRRRSLMFAAASGSLLAPLAGLPGAAQALPSRSSVPAAARFSALVGQRFSVAGRSYRLEAVRTAPRANARLEQFSLVLRGRAGLRDGLHRLHHPALGELQLQLAVSNARGTTLRADISRLA